MARLVGVTYGTAIVGLNVSDASWTLTGRFRYEETPEIATVSCDVVVANASRSTFLTAEAALITAYTKKWQDLTVVMGATTRHTFSHGSNTGFNAAPSISKLDNLDGTGNSTTYRCSVTVQLPEDLAGQNALRDSIIDVDTDASGKRSLTISGTYTASGGTGARAQYEASIDALAATVTTDLTGTWEPVADKAATDGPDKLCTFSKSFAEIIANQSIGTLDAPALVNQHMTITRDVFGISDSLELGPVNPLVGLNVVYSVSVKKSVSTDLESVYTGTIRPHILNQVGLHTGGGGTIIIEQETPTFDVPNNRVAVTMRVLADTGGTFVRVRVEQTDRIDLGVILFKVWDGDPYARDRYDGPQSHVRTIRWKYTYRGGGGAAGGGGGVAGSSDPTLVIAGGGNSGFSISDAFESLLSQRVADAFGGAGGGFFNVGGAAGGAAGAAPGAPSGGADFILVRQQDGPKSEFTIGLPSGAQITLTRTSRTFTYVKAVVKNAGGGGGRQRRPQTQPGGPFAR